jgi:DNA-binding transcriptional LysR family regulator
MNAKLKDHIEKLSLFVAVARAGSFRAAALQINLSQPSLSHSIQVLEETLGAQLFIRSKQGIQPTMAGVELLRFSERLLLEVDGVEQRIKHPENELAGILNIATFASFAHYLWPNFLRHLSKKKNSVQIQLNTVKATEVTAALSSRKYHLILSTEHIHLQEAVNIELYRDSFGFFYSKKLISKALQNPSSWKTLPLLYVPDAKDSSGKTLEQIFSDVGIKNEKRYQLDTFEAVKAIASEGLGIAVLPLQFAAHLNSSHDLTRVNDRSIYGRSYGEHIIYCSILSADRNDLRITWILNFLKEWCSKEMKTN